MSKTISYSEARDNLKTYLDYVVQNNDTVIIKRKDGKNVVIIAEEDYDAMDETAYLLSTENNRKSLLESVASINRGNWKELKSYSSVQEMLDDIDDN
jgi:antitoxin YefM